MVDWPYPHVSGRTPRCLRPLAVIRRQLRELTFVYIDAIQNSVHLRLGKRPRAGSDPIPYPGLVLPAALAAELRLEAIQRQLGLDVVVEVGVPAAVGPEQQPIQSTRPRCSYGRISGLSVSMCSALSGQRCTVGLILPASGYRPRIAQPGLTSSALEAGPVAHHPANRDGRVSISVAVAP